MKIRCILLALIIAFSLVCVACSYATEFYVVNLSEASIEISYKFRALPTSPENLRFVPTIKLASQLEATSRYDLKEVATDRYKIDQVTRTVTVSVLPQEALQITSMRGYTGDAVVMNINGFLLEKVSIAGSTGEVAFSGKQLFRFFSKQSKILYTLTYQ
jgi:hypothetical protein